MMISWFSSCRCSMLVNDQLGYEEVQRMVTLASEVFVISEVMVIVVGSGHVTMI